MVSKSRSSPRIIGKNLSTLWLLVVTGLSCESSSSYIILSGYLCVWISPPLSFVLSPSFLFLSVLVSVFLSLSLYLCHFSHFLSVSSPLSLSLTPSEVLLYYRIGVIPQQSMNHLNSVFDDPIFKQAPCLLYLWASLNNKNTQSIAIFAD